MEPSLPRKRKRQPRYEVGNAETEFHETVEDQYRQMYYQAIDTIIGTIQNLMVLQVHEDLTDKYNLNNIGNEFVGQCEHRLVVLNFVFKETD